MRGLVGRRLSQGFRGDPRGILTGYSPAVPRPEACLPYRFSCRIRKRTASRRLRIVSASENLSACS